MSQLQIVRRRFLVTEKAVGGLDLVGVKEHLRNAPIRVSSHRRSHGDSTLISPEIAQIHLTEMLFRPPERGFLMQCSDIQGFVYRPFAGCLNFNVSFVQRFG